MMNNILLVGFFGEGNLGDEAILEAICKYLPEEITPIITTGKEQNFGISIKRKGFMSWLAYLKAAYASEMTLFVGGILQDWSKEGISFYTDRIIASAQMGSVPILFGVSIGPLRTERARRKVKDALQYVRLAYVRDLDSYKLYKELMPGADVRLGTDWTWAIPIEKVDHKNGQGLSVNLREWKEKDLLNEAFCEIANCSLDKKGVAARPSDASVIVEAIKADSDVVTPTTFQEFAKSCNQSEKGIAMRYHAALAMLRSNLPTKLVCYDDKVKELAHSIGAEIEDYGVTKEFIQAPSDFFAINEHLIRKMLKDFGNLLHKLYGCPPPHKTPLHKPLSEDPLFFYK